ncbi:MAG: hypothetical protein GY805_34800 [Chloroflexi bacterium]|nr:hypothetical protein [Chloroflexota bacterium]
MFGAQFEWQSQIEAAWRGEKNRGETAVLIRNIQSVSVVVHADPDQLTAAPFKTESFSLHPGTLKGKFEQWQTINDGIDPDYEEGHLDWLLQKLVEDEDEEDVQDNRPIKYGFQRVVSKFDLHAPLLAINPALVGYSTELGLTLYPTVPYECKLPQTAVIQQYKAYSYKLESYYRHIELVHQAFVNQSLTLFKAAAQRLEKAYGWRDGIITEMAHLVMAAHDVGKLNQGWQDWAHQWQNGIGKQIENPTYAAAHTDYDPTNPHHQAQNKKMRGKRPSHAVESAMAAVPILRSLTAEDRKKYEPLLRAAFTAVARHHAPFSSQPSSYQLVVNHMQEIENTLQLLPENVQNLCHNINVLATINTRELPTNFLERDFLIKPQDICCYMLLVRALRMADQEGTRLGSL